MHVSIFCKYLTKKLQAQDAHGLARSNSVLKWNVVVEIIEISRLRRRLLILCWLLRRRSLLLITKILPCTLGAS